MGQSSSYEPAKFLIGVPKYWFRCCSNWFFLLVLFLLRFFGTVLGARFVVTALIALFGAEQSTVPRGSPVRAVSAGGAHTLAVVGAR